MGDVITHALVGADARFLAENDRLLNWVCIQEERNGIPPIFIAITRNSYDRGSIEIVNSYAYFNNLRESRYCPTLERAQAIHNILKTRWDMFCILVDAAGCGSLSNDGFWINHIHTNFFNTYNDYLYYHGGEMYGANNSWTSDEEAIPAED